VCLGDRQLADSEETFDVCDKKCFGPASLIEPLSLQLIFHCCTDPLSETQEFLEAVILS